MRKKRFTKNTSNTEPIRNGTKGSQNSDVTTTAEITANDVTDTTPSDVTELGPCKHPLENTWSFWLQANNNKKDWKANLVELTTFDTVEDYWCLYHHMKTPSELQFGQDYAIFKKGIQPMWEDTQNRRGGRWLIFVDRGNDAWLDRVWADSVLMIIGENFEDNDSITGIVVNIRTNSKIGIWTKDYADVKTNKKIGQTLKKVLNIRRKLDYMAHDTSKILYSIT